MANFVAMLFGQPGSEKINMNIDSLWSGGPFEATVGTLFCVTNNSNENRAITEEILLLSSFKI
jgi:signal recognition particle receptor subunit beta